MIGKVKLGLGNQTDSISTQIIVNQRIKNRLGGTFQAGFQSPTCFIFLVAQNRCFLLFAGKQKSLNFNEIQGFA